MDYEVERSWAAKPLFYRAPHPPQVTPREYQHAGVEYHLARDHAMFGDAPGVGKTAECILLSNAINARRTLVVCPASLRLNWEREIWAWSTIPNVETYPINAGRDGVSDRAHYVVISYDLLRNKSILAALLALKWDHMILDEAHYLKDPHGNSRTRPIGAPDALPSVVGRITMATGTPLPNQPVEAYNFARLLNWDAIDRASLASFREHYYDYGAGFVTRTKWVDGKRVTKTEWSKHVRNVPVRMDELQQRLRKHIMVRRLKEDVLPELPKRQWHMFPLAMTPAMKAAMQHPGWAKAEKLWEMDPAAFSSQILVDGHITTARRLLGEAKAPAIAEYVIQLLREGVSKVVVGAWHISVLDILREAFGKEKLAHVYMDGSTSTTNKQRAVDMFQLDASVKIILGQMQPLGKGWTLHAAQDVVLAEPYWVPGENDQILDRTHRFGQTGDRVIGHIPVVPNSLDERVMGVVIEKDKSIYLALDSEGSR